LQPAISQQLQSEVRFTLDRFLQEQAGSLRLYPQELSTKTELMRLELVQVRLQLDRQRRSNSIRVLLWVSASFSLGLLAAWLLLQATPSHLERPLAAQNSSDPFQPNK
jgi:hypothetical protein